MTELLSMLPPEWLTLLLHALPWVFPLASGLAVVVKRYAPAMGRVAKWLDFIAINSRKVNDSEEIKRLREQLRERETRIFNQAETIGSYERTLSTQERELATMRRVMRIADAQPDNDNSLPVTGAVGRHTRACRYIEDGKGKPCPECDESSGPSDAGEAS